MFRKRSLSRVGDRLRVLTCGFLSWTVSMRRQSFTACVDARSRRRFRSSPQGLLRNSIHPALAVQQSSASVKSVRWTAPSRLDFDLNATARSIVLFIGLTLP